MAARKLTRGDPEWVIGLILLVGAFGLGLAIGWFL